MAGQGLPGLAASYRESRPKLIRHPQPGHLPGYRQACKGKAGQRPGNPPPGGLYLS
jgi:hypothetical protein